MAKFSSCFLMTIIKKDHAKKYAILRLIICKCNISMIDNKKNNNNHNNINIILI